MLPLIFTAASAASTIAGGLASRKAGRAQAATYELQAQAKEREARYIQLETAQRKAAGLMRLSSELGTLAVQQSSRNVSRDSGSLGALQEAFTRESFLSINAQELAGLIQRRSAMDEARGLRGGASLTRFQGNMAFATSLLRAGSTIASGTGGRGELGTGGNIRAASISAADVSGASLPALSSAPAPIRY